ncbi:putative RDD family membrane protein YckC [Arthrobacter sp. PvP023]|uniref:RDD family protein n=1 Tax=Micrococcaceae TaxID=1268 RepID=UPI001AE2F454|nr:RDD family protein [Arthrobacter sp. PvP023]MBP1137040.1 putative RDD family membrane protein YckC [Arthrobacter sp. PvP023]
MTHDAERCQRCQQLIRPGATFCPACGAPLSNRAARNDRNIDHSQRELMERAAAHGSPIPGSIPVVQARTEAAGPGAIGVGAGAYGQTAQAHGGHVQGGGTGMGGKLDVVPAAAGRRLGAAVLDWVGPAVLLVVMFTVGFASITRTQSGGFIIYDTGMLVLLGGIAVGITVVYILVLLGIEGRSGTTIGNRLMGIRSTDQDGYAPGAGALFLRGLITGAGILLTVVAAVIVVIFKWFEAALWILAPLALLGVAWAFIVVVSNSWDKNGKLRGWHDTAAKTLMFDVNAGRNPLTTGGIQGPYSFAPLDLPPVQQVSSPVAGAAARPPQAVPVHAPEPQQGFNQPVAIPQPPLNPNQWQPPAVPQPLAGPAASAPAPSAAPAPVRAQPAPEPVPTRTLPDPAVQNPSVQMPSQGWALHPDDDHDRTQMRGQTVPAPVAVLRIRLDDGRDFELDQSVLIGRNPGGLPGEHVAQLLAVADPGRSISKTHLHLRADNGGVWVTDRNSTNGSAVTTPDGIRTVLQAGEPAYVRPGSTVHFGDRTFHLGQA